MAQFTPPDPPNPFAQLIPLLRLRESAKWQQMQQEQMRGSQQQAAMSNALKLAEQGVDVRKGLAIADPNSVLAPHQVDALVEIQKQQKKQQALTEQTGLIEQLARREGSGVGPGGKIAPEVATELSKWIQRYQGETASLPADQREMANRLLGEALSRGATQKATAQSNLADQSKAANIEEQFRARGERRRADLEVETERRKMVQKLGIELLSNPRASEGEVMAALDAQRRSETLTERNVEGNKQLFDRIDKIHKEQKMWPKMTQDFVAEWQRLNDRAAATDATVMIVPIETTEVRGFAPDKRGWTFTAQTIPQARVTLAPVVKKAKQDPNSPEAQMVNGILQMARSGDPRAQRLVNSWVNKDSDDRLTGDPEEDAKKLGKTEALTKPVVGSGVKFSVSPQEIARLRGKQMPPGATLPDIIRALREKTLPEIFRGMKSEPPRPRTHSRPRQFTGKR